MDRPRNLCRTVPAGVKVQEHSLSPRGRTMGVRAACGWYLVALAIGLQLHVLPAGAESTISPKSSVAYRETDGGKFYLDIYEAGGGDRSAVRASLVFFHGGGWSRGGKGQFRRQAGILSRDTQLVTISVDYPTNRNPLESTEFALAATCWIKKNAAKLGIDPARIAVSGGSAGGQLAAAVVLSRSLDVPECRQVQQPYASALILFNPVLDLKGRWERRFGVGLSAISPIDLLDRPLPPTLILQGTADRTTPIRIARRFVAKAKDLGSTDVQLVEFADRGHGFFNRANTGDLDATMAAVVGFLRRLGWSH